MPDLVFERGERDRPAGHAFVYFGSDEERRVAATYIVVPPIPIDFAKYVPPLIASSLGASGLLADAAFLPVPPAPEEIDLDELRRLADIRGDDILVGGSATTLDVASLMSRVAELGDAYARAYDEGLARAPKPQVAAEPSAGTDGLALLYSVLPERERLEELARRVGTLRYALDGSDAALAEATRNEMRAVAMYLPEKYRVEQLIEAASRPDSSGARLAELYIERAYKLASEDYEDLSSIEAQIEALLTEGSRQ